MPKDNGVQIVCEDKRGRKWESFVDYSYYSYICVRPIGITEFDSELSFHFPTYRLASQFINLLKQSS